MKYGTGNTKCLKERSRMITRKNFLNWLRFIAKIIPALSADIRKFISALKASKAYRKDITGSVFNKVIYKPSPGHLQTPSPEEDLTDYQIECILPDELYEFYLNLDKYISKT